MSKMKISQDLADAIEMYKESARRTHERHKRNHQCNLRDWEETLLELPTTDFIEVLFEGYEVEPEFREGDWVVDESDGLLKRVSHFHSINKSSVKVCFYGGGESSPSRVRHATNDEVARHKRIEWWTRHDRDVWGLELYDCVINEQGTPVVVVCVNYSHTKNRTIYEFSNGESYPKNAMKHHFKVLYFAEDRKDIN